MKNWYKSKGMWLGIFGVIGGAVGMVADRIEAGIPVTILGVAQIVIRLVTKEAIGKNGGAS